jgi:hypothetical protein
MIKFIKRFFLALVFVFITGNNYSQCLTNYSSNVFGFDIHSVEFNYIIADSKEAEAQSPLNWHWAACIQMVYNYNDFTSDQIYFVNRIYGTPYINQPDNDIKVLTSLSGSTADFNDKIFLIPSKSNSVLMLQDDHLISFKWPFIGSIKNINGTNNHACMINIYYYKKDESNNNDVIITPEKVIIRELWTQNPAKREFSWIDSKNKMMSLIKVWIL